MKFSLIVQRVALQGKVSLESQGVAPRGYDKKAMHLELIGHE